VLERPPNRLEAARELRRQRNRRLRARRKARRITVLVELGERELDWLIGIGWLQEGDGDRRLIGAKITAGIAVSAAASAKR
jgi:hypothetical protein